jgi:hypothetical protein
MAEDQTFRLADLVAEKIASHIDREDRPAVYAAANEIARGDEKSQSRFGFCMAARLASRLGAQSTPAPHFIFDIPTKEK